MKPDQKAVFVITLIAILSFYGARKDHEAKAIGESKKDVTRVIGGRPDVVKPNGKYDRKALERSLTRLDWKQARVHYQQLLNDDVDLGDYPTNLETRILEQVAPLPGSKYEFNYRGYDLLAAIVPDNQTYKEKAALYRGKIITRSKARIARLKKSTDKIEGITWYEHPYNLSGSKQVSVEFYIGRRGQGKLWLKMRFEYASSYSWIFVEKVIAWHDGIKEPLISGSFERKSSSIVREWLDVTPTELQIEIMRSMSEADEAVLRFDGSRRNIDVTLTKKDKRAITEVLNAYEAMNILAELEAQNR